MTTTPATYIRDEIYKRIENLVEWRTKRKVPNVPYGADQFPRLGVYLGRENETPDGDANVGPPRYISEVTIIISVTEALSKPQVLDGEVDDTVDLIKNTLLQDITFVSLKDESGNFMLDSIPNISRQYFYPNNGDTYYIECRLQMTFRMNVVYEPITPIPFETLAVDARPNDDPVPIGAPYIINIPQ